MPNESHLELIPPELLATPETEAVELALAEGTTPDVFQIDSPELAAWGGAKLAEAYAYIEHTNQMAKEYRARIAEWEDAATKPARATVEFMESRLVAYALAERERTNGRTKTVNLPSGVIRTRPGTHTYVMIDADKFMDWAQEECPDAVKWDRRPLTSALTGLTKVVMDEGAVYARVFLASTGEEIPGLRVQVGATTARVTVG